MVYWLVSSLANLSLISTYDIVILMAIVLLVFMMSSTVREIRLTELCNEHTVQNFLLPITRMTSLVQKILNKHSTICSINTYTYT